MDEGNENLDSMDTTHLIDESKRFLRFPWNKWWTYAILAFTVAFATAFLGLLITSLIFSLAEDKPDSIGTGGLKLKSLSTTWNNCGSTTDAIQIKSLTIEPESLDIPGKITITAQVKITKRIEAPVQAKLTLYRKLIKWKRLPCIHNIGSCNIDDVCSLNILQQFPNSSKFPFACPLSAGTYGLNKYPIEIKKGLPHWLQKGRYKLAVNLYANNYEIACYEFETRVN